MCKLQEWSFSDLTAAQSDSNFLRSAERVRQLSAHGSHYQALRGMSVYFRTPSSEHEKNKKVWTQEIVLLDLPEALGVRDWSLKNKARYALHGDVLVRCDCPAFLYWGFAYQLLQLDAGAEGEYYGGWKVPGKEPTEPGEYPEDKNSKGTGKDGNPPYYIGKRRRNWMQINMLCKHLMFVGTVLKGHWNSVASDLKKQGYK